VEGDGE
jgi:hypothetical protein